MYATINPATYHKIKSPNAIFIDKYKIRILAIRNSGDKRYACIESKWNGCLAPYQFKDDLIYVSHSIAHVTGMLDKAYWIPYEYLIVGKQKNSLFKNSLEKEY